MLEDVSKRLKLDSSEMETDEEQKAEKAWKLVFLFIFLFSQIFS